MKKLWLWVRIWLIVAGVLFIIATAPILLAAVLLAYFGYRFSEFSRKNFNEGLYLLEVQKKEGSHASLEDDYNIDLDREWVGATAARAETIILSGIFSEGK